MALIDVLTTAPTGLVGVLPQIIYVYTSDSLSEVLASGYLNPTKAQGNVYNNEQIAAVITTDGNYFLDVTVDHTGNVTLVQDTGTVMTVTGTANQISVSPTSGNVIVSISNNPILPGTGGVTLPSGTTAQRAGAAGTIRFNSQANVFESTVDGATWATITTSSTGVTSVSGTANRITVSPTTGLVIVDIASTYVGQTSITTLGIVTTGTWNASPITVPYGGTGTNSFTAYGLIAAGVTSTGTFQSVAPGASGQVLTSNGASAIPSMQDLPANVSSIAGTSNQIVVSASTGAVTVSIANNPIFPGSGAITLPAGTTAQRAGGAGSVRYNSQLTQVEFTNDGVSWSPVGTGSGAVTSVSGTANRITVSPTTGNCIVDIAATYTGQSSITTLGTVSTGVWQGTVIDVSYGGTGTNSFTAYGVLCGGTTSTGALQSVASLGSSGDVLTSNGAGMLPTFQTPTGGGGITWNLISGTTQTAAINNGYIIGNSSQTTVTLPTTAPVGSTVIIQGMGAGGWILQAPIGRTIHIGGTQTSLGGTLTSANAYDTVQVVCVVADNVWSVSYTFSVELTTA